MSLLKSIPSLLLIAGLASSCALGPWTPVQAPRDRPVPYENRVAGSRPQAGEPPDRLAAERTWRSERGGYVFRIGYFSRAQVEDRRWEAGRLEMLDQGRFCNGLGEGRIVRREVRWYEATPQSGRRCAALVYTLHCTHPRERPDDALARARIQVLRQDAEEPIEADCGEKDHSRRPVPPPPRFHPPLEEQLSAEASCALDAGRSRGPIRVGPETRIFTQTRVHADFARSVPVGTHFWFRIPPSAIEWIFSRHSRIPPRLRTVPVPDNRINILVVQDYALDAAGRPYCVRLTARQGDRIWQQRIVRPGLVEHLRREVGVDRGVSRDSTRYWDPASDATLLSRALGRYLVAHAEPDRAFRRPWRR